MAQFFFDVQGKVSRQDRTGIALAGVPEAWDEAMQYAADLQAERDGCFKQAHWSLVVTDQNGCLIFRLDFEPTG